MKTPRSDSGPDSRWQEMLRQARADATPPVNVPALLRAVRATAPVPRGGWTTEFSALFAPTRAVVACLACAAICAAITSWEILDLAQSLAWAQWFGLTGGGL